MPADGKEFRQSWVVDVEDSTRQSLTLLVKTRPGRDLVIQDLHVRIEADTNGFETTPAEVPQLGGYDAPISPANDGKWTYTFKPLSEADRAIAAAFLRNARPNFLQEGRFCFPFRIRATAEGMTPSGSPAVSNEYQFEIEACLHENLRSCAAY
jgi:hypothetical protein